MRSLLIRSLLRILRRTSFLELQLLHLLHHFGLLLRHLLYLLLLSFHRALQVLILVLLRKLLREWHPWILLSLVVVLHHVGWNLLPIEVFTRIVSEMGLLLTEIMVMTTSKMVVLVRSIVLVSILPLLLIIIFEITASASMLNLLIILNNLFRQVPDHHRILLHQVWYCRWMILLLVRVHVLYLIEVFLHFVLRKTFLIKQLLKLLLLNQFGFIKFNLQSLTVDGMSIELVSRL